MFRESSKQMGMYWQDLRPGIWVYEYEESYEAIPISLFWGVSPDVMRTVQDVADVQRIGLAHAYEVAHRQDSPAIILGNRIIVPRDRFLGWIEEQTEKKFQ